MQSYPVWLCVISSCWRVRTTPPSLHPSILPSAHLHQQTPLDYLLFSLVFFSGFLRPAFARTISGNQPLSSPRYYPFIPGAHTSFAQTRTHQNATTLQINTQKQQNEEHQRSSRVPFFSFSCRSASFSLCGGGLRFRGTARGRLGLIWALIPSPFPGDPCTNLM